MKQNSENVYCNCKSVSVFFGVEEEMSDMLLIFFINEGHF